MIVFQLFYVFMKIGVFTFGSGYAMLALAEKELVQVRGWLTPDQFSDAVALSEVTPGPIMVNLATFVGIRQQGIPGAIMATLGLITPPIIAIILITKFYLGYRDHEMVRKAFEGLRPAVVGLIIVVVIRLWGASVTDYRGLLVAAGVVGAVLAGLHPILAVVGGGLAGLLFW